MFEETNGASNPLREAPPCVLCGEPTEPWPGGGGFGHNPEPLATEGRACDECNETEVIPARIRELEGR